jgi:hypothetical protein
MLNQRVQVDDALKQYYSLLLLLPLLVYLNGIITFDLAFGIT